MLIEDNASNKDSNQDRGESLTNLEHQIFEREIPIDKSSKQVPQLKENWFAKLINKCIRTLKIVGFNTNSIPAITNMTLFMNETFVLKKEKMMEEALEMDF
mmetsp:Transcript_30590/g.30045  ORF Transcript_30590/g.30045 Transcript_30590/m.30045 type:complete len:101 (-) Transcript_30590:237-539(-)